MDSKNIHQNEKEFQFQKLQISYQVNQYVNFDDFRNFGYPLLIRCQESQYGFNQLHDLTNDNNQNQDEINQVQNFEKNSNSSRDKVDGFSVNSQKIQVGNNENNKNLKLFYFNKNKSSEYDQQQNQNLENNSPYYENQGNVVNTNSKGDHVEDFSQNQKKLVFKEDQNSYQCQSFYKYDYLIDQQYQSQNQNYQDIIHSNSQGDKVDGFQLNSYSIYQNSLEALE
ncbi:hypothetical protein ABPG72_009459 [Tetrahymena utriculariae]